MENARRYRNLQALLSADGIRDRATVTRGHGSAVNLLLPIGATVTYRGSLSIFHGRRYVVEAVTVNRDGDNTYTLRPADPADGRGPRWLYGARSGSVEA